MMSKIIFLNGCSSSGKTTIARNIQSISDKPWVYFSMDNFSDMLPKQYIELGEKAHLGYFTFTNEQNYRGSLIKIDRGPLGPQFFDTLPSIAKLLVDAGNNLIIDEVILLEDRLNPYVKALSTHTVYLIGVFCDLKTLQERELSRGDREIGLVNAQYDLVNSLLIMHDLEVYTYKDTSIKIAEDILNYIEQNPHPQAFKKMQIYDEGNI